MSSVVRVREKGQVTLPLEVRKQLDLREGDLLEAEAQEDRIVLKLLVRRRVPPTPVPIDGLESLVGFVSLGGDAVADANRYEE
ncbi:MAG: AbrB/MazE/SpoVT family DNA-binding domain-containing protein [Dehalococcoidia bacterium]